MSDNSGIRPIPGNLGNALGKSAPTYSHSSGRRPLAEECDRVWIHAVKRALGKRLLLNALRQAKPVRLPLVGSQAELWIAYDLHRLPGRGERWSSLEQGNCRLWFQCTCGRLVAMLYVLPGSTGLVRPLCRHCTRIAYLSTNSAGNRWYAEIVKPIRKLQKEKDRLLARKPTTRNRARLRELDANIWALKERAMPKKMRIVDEPDARVRQRRPYKNIDLLV